MVCTERTLVKTYCTCEVLKNFMKSKVVSIKQRRKWNCGTKQKSTENCLFKMQRKCSRRLIRLILSVWNCICRKKAPTLMNWSIYWQCTEAKNNNAARVEVSEKLRNSTLISSDSKIISDHQRCSTTDGVRLYTCWISLISVENTNFQLLIANCLCDCCFQIIETE